MTIVDLKQISTKPPTKEDRRNEFLMYLVLILIISIAFYNYYKRKNELKKTKNMWAVVTDSHYSRNSYYLKVKFKIGKKTIYSDDFEADECDEDKKIGDTIVINYSEINPKTVEINECYWNENNKRKFKTK
jgi:hypothetical protein